MVAALAASAGPGPPDATITATRRRTVTIGLRRAGETKQVSLTIAERPRLSEDATPGPIRLALVIEDPALADRLAALLAGVPGLRLVVR